MVSKPQMTTPAMNTISKTTAVLYTICFLDGQTIFFSSLLKSRKYLAIREAMRLGLKRPFFLAGLSAVVFAIG